MEKINIRNMYIDLLNKIRNVEGVDKDYVDGLVDLIDQHLIALDSDINAITSVIPDDASATNQLITVDDVPAQVNSDWNATSGPAEILNKPTIPAAQVNSDWNASSGVAQILNKPTLAAVATSGSYTDLLNKPSFGLVYSAYFDIPITGWTTSGSYFYYDLDLGTSTYFDINNIPIITPYPTGNNIEPTAAEASNYSLLRGVESFTSADRAYIRLYSAAVPTSTYRVGVKYDIVF